MAEPDEEPTPSSASNLTCWASGIRFRDTIERAANILESYSAAIVRARAMNKNLDRNDQSTYRLRYESTQASYNRAYQETRECSEADLSSILEVLGGETKLPPYLKTDFRGALSEPFPMNDTEKALRMAGTLWAEAHDINRVASAVLELKKET